MEEREATRIDDSWYVQPAEQLPRRTSAGGVVARLEGGRVLIALAREGDWVAPVLPKGGVEPGEDFEQAARREVHEEVGISRLTLLAPLGVLSRLSYQKDLWVTTHFFLFRTDQREGTPLDAERHIHGPIWRAPDQLADMFWPDQRALIERCVPLIERHL